MLQCERIARQSTAFEFRLDELSQMSSEMTEIPFTRLEHLFLNHFSKQFSIKSRLSDYSHISTQMFLLVDSYVVSNNRAEYACQIESEFIAYYRYYLIKRIFIFLYFKIYKN